jgi:asparagine synthetase B (glutamine-hydrolysing)
MCGIFFSIGRDGFTPPSVDLLNLLSKRGPDCIHEHQVRVACPGTVEDGQGNTNAYLSFTSSVLSVRGAHITGQPLIDGDSGSLLCWNGDAWKINGAPIVGNDTEAVFALLLRVATSGAVHTDTARCPKLVMNTSSTDDSRLDTLYALGTAIESISGPFAFIFYDALNQRVVFGRDCLGRRSLLQRHDDKGNLVVSSVSDGCPGGNWSELDDKGMYWIDLVGSDFHLHEAIAPRTGLNSTDGPMPPFYQPSKLPWTFTDSTNEATLEEARLVSPVSILPTLLDSNGCIQKLPFPPLNMDLSHGPISPLSPSSPSVSQLRRALIESLILRVRDIPERTNPGNLPCSVSLQPEMTGKPARVAILFSGGLDCTILARLVHDILPSDQPIDLLNIAFENPRVLEASKTSQGNNAKPKKKTKKSNTAPTKQNSNHRKLEDPMALSTIVDGRDKPTDTSGMPNPYEICPDRITGRKSLAELREVCDNRRWNFVEVGLILLYNRR